MKYIHCKLSNLIGQFERTMVQVYLFVCCVLLNITTYILSLFTVVARLQQWTL